MEVEGAEGGEGRQGDKEGEEGEENTLLLCKAPNACPATMHVQ